LKLKLETETETHTMSHYHKGPSVGLSPAQNHGGGTFRNAVATAGAKIEASHGAWKEQEGSLWSGL
jgi:hypothetical protein